MTYREAAQSALDVQNGCNTSGILKSLAGPVIDAIREEANRTHGGNQFINRSPIVAMYLYKVGELNGRDISSLNDGYDKAAEEVRTIAEGGC